MLSLALAAFSLLTVATANEALKIGARAEREACPYWKAVGILSDHMELACGGGLQFQNAVQRKATERESPALACCPEPYGNCRIEERVNGCDDLIAPILMDDASLTSKDAWLLALQKARGALVAADSRCSVLAPQEPYATCNGELISGRDDIYCEMMIFQTEQFGDGNPDEYEKLGCPFPGPEVQAQGQQHGQSMDRALKKGQVPPQWKKQKKEL